MAGLPALPDALGAEIDVLGVVLVRQRRRQQPHHMHAGQAAIGGHFSDAVRVAHVLRQKPAELGHDMAQPVELPDNTSWITSAAPIAVGVMVVLMLVWVAVQVF